ncbi:dihydrofolate reductase [Gammaproteobacteria bacterium]|nr:dihydrofolate reductase [Gammaproteobacteria bacterium]
MKLSLIVAMAENRTIGRDNTLPWHLSEDLKYFRRTTTGHCIIMGRNTWESIGRPLPNRRSIVVSSNPNYVAAAKSLAESISAELGVDEAFVIGGARLYADALQQAECFHLTRVQASVEGDTYLPEFDEGEWQEVAREEFAAEGQGEGENPYAYSICRLVRLRR